MMSLHLIFFLFLEVAIFSETLFGVLYWHDIMPMQYNTYKVIDVMLNIAVAVANFCTNAWIAYLMISFCDPDEIGKSKGLFKRLLSFQKRRERNDVLFDSLIENSYGDETEELTEEQIRSA